MSPLCGQENMGLSAEQKAALAAGRRDILARFGELLHERRTVQARLRASTLALLVRARLQPLRAWRWPNLALHVAQSPRTMLDPKTHKDASPASSLQALRTCCCCNYAMLLNHPPTAIITCAVEY